jgi:2-polyprenyl-6-methoxyphenol hydroxylase-like FAD-dependent oxidoreductase
VARFVRPDGGERVEVTGDLLIRADGIHSRVRGIFYPEEEPPRWSGEIIWRGQSRGRFMRMAALW